jgi:DNA-binding NtrC family response regulator
MVAIPRLLIVDDDRHTLMVLHMMFSRYEDPIIIDTTCSPYAALEMLISGRYDVVLTDQHMPGMTGLELGHHIHTFAPTMPLIVMTQAVDLTEVQDGCSVFALLPKPPDHDLFKFTLRRAFAHCVSVNQTVTQIIALAADKQQDQQAA